MKFSFLLPAPFVLASSLATTAVELVFEPEEETVLARHFEATLDMDLSEYGLALDGEDLEVQEVELNIFSVESIEVSDLLVEVDDGRPIEMERTFGKLTQEGTVDANGDETEQFSTSALEGRVLYFEWDEGAEYYTIESADDEGDLDDETLEWLEEDMDLRAVLPEDEVEIGDSWEIDEAVYLPLMWPGGLLGFRDEGEDDVPAYSRELNQAKIENLSGEGEATLEEIRDEDDVRVAVIRIELAIETSASATDGEGPIDIEHNVEISRQLEGVVLWDLDHGHLHSVELEADLEMTHTRTQTFESEGELEEQQSYEGTVTYIVTVERE